MTRFPSWHFREMDPGEMHVDPVHDEFFKMQDLADALVRESIQNSLDARRPRTSVRVRFAFGTGAEALPAEAVRDYFGGLREHLEAVSSSIHSILPTEKEPLPYLLVEDFGTRGLSGEPEVDPELESEPDARNDFFYFWRNVGRSSKGEVDRGRWGLGKAVFSVASRIRTVFGLTIRSDDMRALLLGQSVLKTHILDGTRIYPYGFFARFERRNGLPLPIEEPMLLERFADDFRLHRSEPGLSMVIPYFREDELSFDRIVESAIRQYFYPILRGELTVEVEGGGRKETINDESISRLVSLVAAGDRIERTIALARWSLFEGPSHRIELPAMTKRAPKWNDEVIAENVLDPLREQFERGERIAIRVPLLVKRKRVRPASSFFDVYLERDDALRKGEYHFIRRGITIPDVRPSAPTEKPVRALVVVDHEALSTFLGDAENPAHSDWSERADKLRTTYDHHAATIRYVKNSAAFLASLLGRAPAGRVRDFLQDLFSIEMPGDGATTPAGKRAPADGRGESGRRPGVAQRGGTAGGVTILPVAGGFTIHGSGAEPDLRPLRAEIAYRVRSGNAFRKHSPFDFDLTRGDVAIAADGVTVRPESANTLFLKPVHDRFQITLKGFDARRDVVVRLSEIGPDASETELH